MGEASPSFAAVWRQTAADRALLPNSVDSYWSWTKLFFRFTGTGAAQWSGRDWERFERWLLAQRYSYSARRQARCALNFIFRYVLKIEVGKLNLPIIPKPEAALVVVPTREELARIFTNLHGQERLACRIMHGSGSRVQETCRIRVQDVDLERARLRLWDGKGEKNRETVLPLNLLPLLGQQIEWRRALHERDLADGNGLVELPARLGRKMRGTPRELGWQWLLASSEVRKQHRWYLSPDTVSGALLAARRAAGTIKRVTCHSLRKAFATEAQQAGMDVRTIQALLGHADMNTTATHYLAVDLRGAFSPADVPSAQLGSRYSLERREALMLA
jgi:integrase